MTPEGWLRALDKGECLPSSRRDWHQLTKNQKAEWLVFRDWLVENNREDLVALVDLVSRPQPRGRHAFSGQPESDWFLRPCDGFGPWKFHADAGWMVNVQSDVGTHLPVSQSHRALLSCWAELFTLVAEHGLEVRAQPAR
jgi:hypothetical protein